MATSLQQIATFLEKRQLKFVREDANNRILLPFQAEDNEKVVIVVVLEENGEFLKILSPSVLTYRDGPHRLVLFQAMLEICWETKMLQWEYDPSDGEIRAIIEFPLEDAALTERQFFRAFEGLLQLLNLNRPRLKTILATGVDPKRGGGAREGAPDPLVEAFRRHLSGDGGGSSSTGGGRPPDAL